MASKISINLDTSKENYLVCKCKQNDNLTLEAFIYENGLALDLANKTITIQALKADGTYIIQNTDITKTSNKINAELVRDFSRVPGTTKTEVVLIESGKQNTTFSFTLEVVGSVIRGAVQSGDTVTILEKLQDKIVEAGAVKEETEQLIENGGAATTGQVKEITASLEQINQQKANKNEVANGLRAKGNSLYANLPTTNNIIGDYYYCSDGDGINPSGNYVWNGTKWYFGGTGDNGYNKIMDIVGSPYTTYSEIMVNSKGLILNQSFKSGDIIKFRLDSYNGNLLDRIMFYTSINGTEYVIAKDFLHIGDEITYEFTQNCASLKWYCQLTGIETETRTFSMSFLKLNPKDLIGSTAINEYRSSKIIADNTVINAKLGEDVSDYSLVLQTSKSYTLEGTFKAGDRLWFNLKSYNGTNLVKVIFYTSVDGSTFVSAMDNLKIGDTQIYQFTSDCVAIRFYCNISASEGVNRTFVVSAFNLSQNTINAKLQNIYKIGATNFFDKTIAFLGDSFTEASPTTSYAYRIGQMIGCTSLNYGKASSRISIDISKDGTTIQSFLNRYASMPDNVDVVVVFGGINDAFSIGDGSITLGNINSTLGTSTFYGALKLLCENLIKKYPTKTIIGVIPPDMQTGDYYIANMPSIQNACREVYEKYGIPYCDLKKNCYKMGTMPELVAIYRSASDNIHPSANAGQNAIAQAVISSLKQYIPVI